MNSTAELGGVLTRPKNIHLVNISRKSAERQVGYTPPADIVVRKPRQKKSLPEFVARDRKPGEAAAREYNTLDKPPYATGDGDITYALRPGALDFKKYASFGNRT